MQRVLNPDLFSKMFYYFVAKFCLAQCGRLESPWSWKINFWRASKAERHAVHEPVAPRLQQSAEGKDHTVEEVELSSPGNNTSNIFVVIDNFRNLLQCLSTLRYQRDKMLFKW